MSGTSFSYFYFPLDIEILCPETCIFVFHSDIDVLSVYHSITPIVPYRILRSYTQLPCPQDVIYWILTSDNQ